MTNFLTEQEFAIAMAVVSTATMMMGFLLGFSLCYVEKELLMGEVNELVDRAIEKKFERDEYVLQLEGTIAELQRCSEKTGPVLKRRRTMFEGSSSDDESVKTNVVTLLPAPEAPIKRTETYAISEEKKED